MSTHAILQPAENLTLSDFDQCMFLTEDITKSIAEQGLHECVSIHPRFRNTNLTWEKFQQLLTIWLGRYPGSKTLACMYELDETKEWAFKTYQKSIPRMLDALTSEIPYKPAFADAIANLRSLNHRFGIVTHSHRQLVWGMAEHMGFSAHMEESDIFDIVNLHNDGKYTGIGWMRVMEHFNPKGCKTRNWLDDDLKNHHLPYVTGFECFYVNPEVPPSHTEHLKHCSTFTEAMGIIALQTTLRQAA